MYFLSISKPNLDKLSEKILLFTEPNKLIPSSETLALIETDDSLNFLLSSSASLINDSSFMTSLFNIFC